MKQIIDFSFKKEKENNKLQDLQTNLLVKPKDYLDA
jgi:hypothetical protein